MKRLGRARTQGSNSLELRAPSVPGTLIVTVAAMVLVTLVIVVKLMT